MGEVISFCPACGAHHRDDAVPVLCYNLLLMAQALYDATTQGDSDAADTVADACAEVLGLDESDDEDDIFGEHHEDDDDN